MIHDSNKYTVQILLVLEKGKTYFFSINLVYNCLYICLHQQRFIFYAQNFDKMQNKHLHKVFCKTLCLFITTVRLTKTKN